jgi:hypothetical protein
MMSREYLEAARWLKSHRKSHPFKAVSATFEKVLDREFNDPISRVTAFGCRTWAFRSEEDRDRFVETVETAEPAGKQ